MPATPRAVEAGAKAEREELSALVDQILAREAPALRRVAALYETDPAGREDLFQDICLALWLALPRFRAEASHRTYVFRIAHNRGLTHRSRRRTETRLDPEAAVEIADSAPGPEARRSEDERRRALAAAVAALPLPYRQVLALALENLSHREIAEVLGLTETNVAVRLSRAREKLRARLTGRVDP